MSKDFRDFLRCTSNRITARAGEEVSEREALLTVLHVLLNLNSSIHKLGKQVQLMSETTVTRDQLDAAIAQLLQAEATRDQAVLTALTDLQAKIAGGTVTPDDFSAELATITTLATNAASLTQTATADDPGPTTVPTTPIDPAGDDTTTEAAS